MPILARMGSPSLSSSLSNLIGASRCCGPVVQRDSHHLLGRPPLRYSGKGNCDLRQAWMPVTARVAEQIGDRLALARDQRLFCANAPMANCGASQEWRGLQGGLAFAGFVPIAWIEPFSDSSLASVFLIYGITASVIMIDQMFDIFRENAPSSSRCPCVWIGYPILAILARVRQWECARNERT